MYGFVYVTINKINNRKYVGRRKYSSGWQNYLGSGKILSEALLKYGEQNFHRVILEEFSCEKDLLDAEVSYISIFRAVGENLYNISDGGSDGFTSTNSPMKDPVKAKAHSVWVKANHHQKRPDVAAAHKLMMTNRNPMRNPDTIKKYFAGDASPSKRPEFKAKLSKIFKDNNPMNKPECRSKMAATQKLRMETGGKQKLSETVREKYKNNPELCVKISETLLEVHKSNPNLSVKTKLVYRGCKIVVKNKYFSLGIAYLSASGLTPYKEYTLRERIKSGDLNYKRVELTVDFNTFTELVDNPGEFGLLEISKGVYEITPDCDTNKIFKEVI